MILQFSERLGKIISKFLGSYINRSSGGDIPARLLYGRRGSLNNRVSPIKTAGKNHFIAASSCPSREKYRETFPEWYMMVTAAEKETESAEFRREISGKD